MSRTSAGLVTTLKRSATPRSRPKPRVCNLRMSVSSDARWILDDQLEQKPIELGLGQVVSPLRFDGVLRGHDQKRRLDRIAHAVDRHPVLLHDLQQRRMGLGRRAIDLIGQQAIA